MHGTQSGIKVQGQEVKGQSHSVTKRISIKMLYIQLYSPHNMVAQANKTNML